MTTDTSLSQRALLAFVTISLWTARRKDTNVSKEVTSDKSATPGSASVYKNLLAAADDKLKAIATVGNRIRKYLEQETLPWDDAGNRLLPNGKALSVITELKRMKDEFDAAVDDFVRDYPALRQQAIANLGDLGESTDYPAADKVRAKFSVRLSFTPVAENFDDVRMGMSQQEAEALGQHYAARVREQVVQAQTAAWGRLIDRIRHLHERLTPEVGEDGTPKTKVLRQSALDSFREQIAQLRDLNVFDDVDLDAACSEAEQRLLCYTTEDLRTAGSSATLARQAAEEMLDRYAEFAE